MLQHRLSLPLYLSLSLSLSAIFSYCSPITFLLVISFLSQLEQQLHFFRILLFFTPRFCNSHLLQSLLFSTLHFPFLLFFHPDPCLQSSYHSPFPFFFYLISSLQFFPLLFYSFSSILFYCFLLLLFISLQSSHTPKGNHTSSSRAAGGPAVSRSDRLTSLEHFF